MQENKFITISYGDHNGHDLMAANLDIIRNSGARIQMDAINIGQLQYDHGFISGIDPNSWEVILKNKILLLGPTAKPSDENFISPHISLSSKLDLFANLIIYKNIWQVFDQTLENKNDIIVFAESPEGLNTAINRQQTRDCFESGRVVSKSQLEKLCNFAFEFARLNHRQKLTCIINDDFSYSENILKTIFGQYATKFPDLQTQLIDIDQASPWLINAPNDFDIIVTSNICISSITNILDGNFGFAANAYLGNKYVLFMGKQNFHAREENIGNVPLSSLLLSSALMLQYIGHNSIAKYIEDAWQATLNEGIFPQGMPNILSANQVTSDKFIKAIKLRIGSQLEATCYIDYKFPDLTDIPAMSTGNKELVGLDVFFDYQGNSIEQFATNLINLCQKTKLKLLHIASRGLTLWPGLSFGYTPGDYCRARFVIEGDNKTINQSAIIHLLAELTNAGISFIKSENLYNYNNQPGFTLVQGG